MINTHLSKFSRNIPSTLFLALAFLLIHGMQLVQAQGDDDVTLTARAGFDRYCKEGHWLPVRVEVQNSGPDLEATVQVKYSNGSGGDYITSTELALPSTSHKEVVLYVFPRSSMQDMAVSLLVGKRKITEAKIPVRCLGEENLLFGVLAGMPSTYDVLNDVKPLKGFVRVAQLETSDLPDRAQAWNSLDALIISNTDTAPFTPEQKKALELWLGSGGKLLVVGGPNWQGTIAGIKEFVPVDIQSTQNLTSLSELQAYFAASTTLRADVIVAVGKVHEGADVLVQQNGVPILVQKQMGFGRVYYFAADPALRPLSDWQGMEGFYDLLLSDKPTLPPWSTGNYYGYGINQALGALDELGVPSILYICSLLAFYVLIIGPVNYLVLRLTKRREFGWISIPALVVIFSCLSYGFGFFYRGVTPILNRLVVVQAWDGIENAQVRVLTGIYSPFRAKYDLQAGDQFMPRVFEGDNGNLQANNDWIITQEGDDMIMPDVGVEISGMKVVDLSGYVPALPIEHNLVLVTGNQVPDLVGEIQNQSDYTLKDAAIITPVNWQRLGDFKPSETKQIDFSLFSATNAQSFYFQDPTDILGLGYSNIQTDRDAIRTDTFLRSLLAESYYSRGGNWGIYLIGWLDKPMVPVGLQDQNFKAVDTVFYVDMLSPSVKVEGDLLSLQSSLFTWESSVETASPYHAWQVPVDGYVLRFKPAFPIHRFHNVRYLSLSLASSSTLSPGQLISSAWDFSNDQWVQVSSSTGDINLPEPERFVGPGGEVRIKVAADQNSYIELSSSSITLVVEP